uniref:HMA domain-containing protein n=1 Tax=Opuntia streptacantha TaxID=393608 RepID=A0A7C9E3T6_OPUST
MGEEAKQDQAPAEANKPEEKPAVEEKKEEHQPPVVEEKEKKEKKEEALEPPPPAEEEKKKEEEPPQPPPPFVLYVDLHCVGCAKKIQRSIMKIRGVEGVTIDMDKNQVTIKGVVEPEAICNMIMKKTKRNAKVLSPLPPNEGEPMPQVVTSQVSGLTTVELNVNMHCEACAAQLKKKVLKMRGVQTAETELSSGKVTVTGTMDPNKLVEYVYRRTKKQARIVPQPEPEPKPEKPPEEPKTEGGDGKLPPEEAPKEGGEGAAENKEEGGGAAVNMEEETMKRMMYYYYNYQQPLYVIESIPPPQLFSDENPNACTIS